MNQSQVQDAAFKLVAALWQHGFLSKDDALVHPYMESEDVRDCVRRLADNFGIKVVRQEKHLHIMAQPRKSLVTNPISELRKGVKGWDTQIDLYLMGIIWLVIFSEADNEISVKIKWENEGLSYGEIEELVTNALKHWYELNKESNNEFSREWSLAVNNLYDKWKLLRYKKETQGRVVYIKESRFGLIDTAARLLEKDKMVFIERTAQTSRVTPTPVFFERLKARFGNMDNHQERYDMLKVLLEDAKESGEVGA
ncbi:DUF6063 family protein [Niallia taxi]|uniref:DUF6063 family protein n=1 Tax=Niallia taxi TaxID=2499688 RepID=UPI0021A7C376|nr:DUF6063 family protein [Niallia taxi]MCT2347105.1 DUF6063 family protein [Niallia taxi]